MRRRAISILIALMATISLACGGGGESPKPTTPPQPASTQAPTVVPIPTPSPSPVPTATSIPTATQTPTMTRPPLPEFPSVTVTGLIATLPGYASIDLKQAAELVELVYPGRVPSGIQALALLTEDDETYLVLAIDTNIDRFITAGTVVGNRIPEVPGLPEELDFIGRFLVSDDVTLLEPERVTPDQINQNPDRYAFKRIISETTYLVSSIRVSGAPEGLDHIAFSLATDNLGSESRDDYLTVIDPYNTEAQIRVADLVGTVLFPTEGMRRLLGELLRFTPDDIEEALSRPAVFYEQLEDDEAQLLNIGDLAPTIEDPSLKLQDFHGEMVSIQGIALGGMVRSEDIPVLQNIPVGLTLKAIGVVDLTGAMPIVSISSQDVSGEVFGFFKFNLSVYSFADQLAYAFLVSKEAIPLDPVAEVNRAELGSRVKATLNGYTVTETQRIQVAEDLTFEQVDLLIPTNAINPLIMTRHSDLSSGDFLDSVSFDGFFIDGRLVGVPENLLTDHGMGVVVVNEQGISFDRGISSLIPTPVIPTPPVPLPIPTSTPTTIPTPTSAPTPQPSPMPVPTATPVPTPSVTPRRLSGQPYLAEDGVEVTLTSLNTSVVGNVTTVSISYTLRNTTEDLKDEESWKLYYSGGGGLPQYGFFGQLLPGQTINRSYTFAVQSPDVPLVVAYPSRFFAETWEQGDLIWNVDE